MVEIAYGEYMDRSESDRPTEQTRWIIDHPSLTFPRRTFCNLATKEHVSNQRSMLFINCQVVFGQLTARWFLVN